MEYRRLGRTNLNISRIAYGGLAITREQAIIANAGLRNEGLRCWKRQQGQRLLFMETRYE